MGDSDTSGFGKFVPGFDFLQSLAKGASGSLPQMPSLGNWVAPTLNVEELDKRIGELKNVHFWLEQNSRALAATIQALEVQKMTLATLKGMNFNIADVANAFQLKTADAFAAVAQRPAEEAPAKAPEPVVPAAPTVQDPPPEPAQPAAAKAVPGLVDPLQLWGSLAQQFQQIAAGALQEAAAHGVPDLARKPASSASKAASKPKAVVKKPAAKKSVAKKAAARKAAPRRSVPR